MRGFRQLLDESQIDHHLTETVADLRAGVMAGKHNHPTTILAGGFTVSTEEQRQLGMDLRAQLKSQDVSLVTLNGSLPNPSCMHLLVELVTICHEFNVPVWVDSYGPAMNVLLQSEILPELVKPNQQEFNHNPDWLHE